LTVADQLHDLEKVLKHQKQRGNWGEASLKLALENFLPQDAFEMPYRFSDGEIVDAIIRTKEGLIPVDAKFSLDNYQRLMNADDGAARIELEREFRNDLKKRIDETAKYIRPKEGTLPFAIMYIPAEGIYYDLLVNDVGTTNARKLIDYAYSEKNVVITSPTTFLAYLQTIMYGFRAFKFEESIKHVQKNVEQLLRHLHAYEEHFASVGKSLNAVVNHFDKAQTQYRLVDKDILKITDESNSYEPLALERPKAMD
jgi:DNA recombination protein RmuC